MKPDKENLEIEFKTLISKQDYEELLKEFNITDNDIKCQTNYYFDTNDHHFKSINTMVRIRQKKDSYKITTKTKTDDNTNIENHIYLTPKQAIDMIEKGMDGKILGINDTLYNIATLKTYRVSFEYMGGKLFLDKSIYHNTTDYEIEYEASDKDKGNKVFNDFLNSHNILKQTPISKVKRALSAINSK